MSQPYNGPPSDSNTPTQDRGLFSHEAQKHESHHYLRMYGGQVVNAAMMGFGMTLGADAANVVVGDAKVCMEWVYMNMRLEETREGLLTGRGCVGVVAALRLIVIT